MKIKMCIFGKIVSCIALGAVMGGAYIALPAYAVIDNTGCDNENNLYINPDLALCSTHVYNIGLIENPKNSTERQIMQDVVALKTTLMTQQMYSQYEILATTVKRLRTQLQKEVLLAKLKSASATANGGSYNDSSSTGNAASSDRNVVLSSAKNCPSLFRDNAQVLNCEFDNLDRVLENASSNRGDAARQLEKDITVISRIITSVPDPNGGKDNVSLRVAIPACDSPKKQSDIETCVYSIRTYMSTELQKLNRSNNQQRNNSY